MGGGGVSRHLGIGTIDPCTPLSVIMPMTDVLVRRSLIFLSFSFLAPSFLTLDGEDERRVAVGVLRVDIDPRKREQLTGLALTTCGKRKRG